MPLYGFVCDVCGEEAEEFRPVAKCQLSAFCPVCSSPMVRKYTPPAVRPNGIRKTPPGMVEMGNDYPSIREKDPWDGVEKEMNDILSQSDDAEVRAMNA